MAITHELQRYYEDRQAMMGSQAWLDLIEDVKAMRAATNTLSGVTADNLRFKQGEISIMDWLLSLSDMTNAVYEELQNAVDV